jgi:hypothetical protein
MVRSSDDRTYRFAESALWSSTADRLDEGDTMGSTQVTRGVRIAGLVVLLVAASAIGPLAWGRLQGAFGVTASSKPVVVPITPFRLVDTRPAVEDPVLGGPDEPIGQGETRTYQVAGVQSVPGDAVGVVLNITALSASATSFLTVFPAGSSQPSTSTLNPAPGLTVFNSATVLLGGGKFSVFHNAGTVHMIIDVVGYLQDHNHDERYLEQSAPVVIGESAGSWRTLSTGTYTAFDIIGPDALMGATGIPPTSGSNNTAIYSLPLTQPPSVGGTSYRLSSVEYCLRFISGGVKVDAAQIYSDNYTSSLPLTLEVDDATDRTALACYSVNTANGAARAYAFLLRVTQVTGTTGGVIVTGVRSTWVPTATAVPRRPGCSAPGRRTGPRSSGSATSGPAGRARPSPATA